MTEIDRKRIKSLLEQERTKFAAQRPRSKELFERARASLLGGVPMHWMAQWASPYPIFAKEAKGAFVTDVDGHRYLDLCLGDTGAMFGHSPRASVEAAGEQLRHGVTVMLPTEDSLWVGEELARRFGLPYWQVAATATDANRFVIRLAREITKRKRILVFNGCYHGSVDEALVRLENGEVKPRRHNVGPPVDPALTTRVVEFNDLEGLEKALSHEDVACVLAEPAMTNIGIILPEPGYHDALRELTRRYGTLLIIDETHTICAGPGGYTWAYDLDPDVITLGKPIASGIPAAVYGFSEELARTIEERTRGMDYDVAGIGGTLSGNAFQLKAMRVTLEKVMTEEAYDRMIPLAERLTAAVDGIIKRNGLPWQVTRLGARAEYSFRATAPRNGGEALSGEDPELKRLIHLFFINRGILLTPFHNMVLISPETREKDVDYHGKVLSECVEALLA